VWALAASGSNVYAGGNFMAAGGVSANFVARWGGSAWSELSFGVNSVAYAVASTNVYVGGCFFKHRRGSVARWDGSACWPGFSR
jgi:hypothetical protein